MTDFAAHAARAIHRLGSAVTITPTGQPARVVNAIFSTTPGLSLGMIDGYSPMLRMTMTDGSGLAEGNPAVVNGVSYTISRLQTDHDVGDVLATLETA
ncbi:hypothetical protein [Malikia spinosa]|uniref:head-tail joining protein n=1 Tax=Malikia spinosa TaxID=86180 RepID=UPI002FD9A44A